MNKRKRTSEVPKKQAYKRPNRYGGLTFSMPRLHSRRLGLLKCPKNIEVKPENKEGSNDVQNLGVSIEKCSLLQAPETSLQGATRVMFRMISISNITHAVEPYSEVHDSISNIVNDQPGFVRVVDENGSFYVISEKSLILLQEKGFCFAIGKEIPEMNNLSMYKRVGCGELLVLPAIDYNGIRKNVRTERREAIVHLLSSGNLMRIRKNKEV